MPESETPKTQITNNYYNCKFETSNANGVPVLVDTSKVSSQQTVKPEINEQNELAYKTMLKNIAKEVNQPEALIELVIKYYTEYDIR